jgi:hypothetical protein
MIRALLQTASLLLLLTGFFAHAADQIGVAISYQLPTDGPLPKTYRVTLAACDLKNPDWIVSTFAAGIVRTDLGWSG